MSPAADSHRSPDGDTATSAPRWLDRAVVGLGLGYLVIAFWVMVDAAPKVPYADTYRFLATFLEQPFPADVLQPDNGHREVITNTIRVLELELFDANQWLQISVGFGLLAVLGCTLAMLRTAPRASRPAAAGLLLLGLFWLGNWRKLAHGSEVMHLTFVFLGLVLGLRALMTGTTRGAIAAAGLGILATLSFGSGPACFAAFFVTLLVQRAPRSHWLWVGFGALLAAAALFGARESGTAKLVFAPFEQLANLMHLLGAPFVWVFSPLLDAEHAARLPGPLAPIAGLVAQPLEAATGPHLQARWPAVGFGALGLGALLWHSGTTIRAASASTRAERFALGLMWFGVTVPALIALVRVGYFREHPEQLTTQRYLPWVMMFWIGCAWRIVMRPTASPRRIGWFALATLLVFAPSQVWNCRNAYRQYEVADATAAAAAVGVLDREFDLTETEPKDLARALPLLRQHGTAMFAWPETALLGTRPDVESVSARNVRITSVANAFSDPTITGKAIGDPYFTGPGCGVTFAFDGSAARLLLLDATGTVRGLAVPAGQNWRGWWRGAAPPNGSLRVAEPE